jgi:hypothetical protein
MDEISDTWLRVLETRVNTLPKTVAVQLAGMNDRIDDLQATMRTWMVVWATITAAHMAATVPLAVAIFQLRP